MPRTRAQRRQAEDENDDLRAQVAMLVQQVGRMNVRLEEIAAREPAPSVAASVYSGRSHTSSRGRSPTPSVASSERSERSHPRSTGRSPTPSVAGSDRTERSYARSGKGRACSEKSAAGSIRRQRNSTESVRSVGVRQESAVQPISNDLRFFATRQTLERGIKLPQFSGDPREWATFYELYQRLSTTCQYTNEENLSRLHASLTGEARKSVHALLAHPRNVPKIMEILRKNFGRPALVLRMIQSDLIMYPAIEENDFQSLISFSLDVQNYVATLETLECQEYKLDPTLLDTLVNKLPMNLKVQWGEHVAQNDLYPERVSDFSLWFENKADAFRVVATGSSQVPLQLPTCQPHVPGNANGQAGLEKKRERPAKTCGFCTADGHGVGECPKWSKEPVEKRWRWADANGFCYRCLKGRHQGFRCGTQEHCGHCRGPHHSTLHRGTGNPGSKSAQVHQEQEEPEGCEGQEHHTHGFRDHDTGAWKAVLKVLPVRLYGPKGVVDTYALLDDASSITMIEKDIATRLGLQGKKRPLSLAWTGDITRMEADSEQVNLEVSKRENDAKRFKLIGARTVEQLGLKPQNLNVEDIAKRWPFVLKAAVKALVDAKPTIIIGQDNWPLLFSRQAYYGPWNGPIVSLTWLGWVLHGKLPQKLTDEVEVSHFNFAHWEDVKVEDPDEAVGDLIRKHLALDEVGATPAKEISQDEEKAMVIFNATTRRRQGESGRWETGLLWKEEWKAQALPESKRMALRRLYSLETKLDLDPEGGARYCAKMQENFDKGYARVLSEEEARVEGPKTWYLPHLGIVNPNKPAKLRVCFDASAKSNGYCFNDFLYKGPDLYQSIPGLLMNFRRWKIAFTADIKEMFPQIKIRKEDQNAQRFVWRGMDRAKPPQVCAMTSMMFGSICSPFSAQEVRTRNAFEFRDVYPQAARAIANRHYMDDYVESVHTEAEAVQLAQDVITVHRKGGFEICGWASNSPEVMRSIPPHLRGNCDKEFQCGNVKILGLVWETSNDDFVMEELCARWLSRCERDKPATRRRVLRGVMSIYDPLGFFTYVTIQGRILAQDICREKGDWNDLVTKEREQEWRKWVTSVETLKGVKLPRVFSPLISEEEAAIQLHIFCDAGARAYTAVAYLRVELKGRVDVCLLYSRARVAPRGMNSVPRLELQGAVLAAVMGEFLNEHLDLPIQRTFFWTDSQVVLHWLRAPDKRYPTFVANRIRAVLGKSQATQWRHVPTGDNAADFATKEKSNQSEKQWWRGPGFLKGKASEWPIEINMGEPTMLILECDSEAMFLGLILTETQMQELPDVNGWR